MAKGKWHQYADERLREYLRRHYNAIAGDVRSWNIDRAPDGMTILSLTLYVHDDFMATEEEIIARDTERHLETESKRAE